MKFVVDQERCVGCLACVRVCPTEAIAVPAEGSTVAIVDDSCIRCGLCLPVCPEDAIAAVGNLQTALALAGQPETLLILGTEAPAHFYPATPEQVVNACYAAGFPVVSRGILGDELVAEEYMRLWEEEGWGTMIRSTDPVVVGAIGLEHPELIAYLAPVTTPPVAEARYLRQLGGDRLRIVYAGSWPVSAQEALAAVITFRELEELFGARGVTVLEQPTVFSRVPMERRRHLSLAGGFPSPWLGPNGGRHPKVHRIRGLDGLKALARAVTVDRINLGFVDLLSCEGALGYPAAGPKEELFWRRSVVQTTEPPRSRTSVLERTARSCVGAVFAIVPPRPPADPEAVAGVLAQVGTTPRGTPWDCGACGFATCREFAAVAVAGRTTLRLCPMYLDRRAKESQEEAARDFLTGLATRAVADGRGEAEVERAKRSQERFSVLFVDLDRFKAINDGYGHPAGDEVLRGVAAEMAGAVRASDLASRYAGDEFLVILPRTDGLGAVRVAEAQRSGVERTGQRLGFAQGLVTVSIGIAVWDPAKPESWRDLLERADQAMFAAKARGRNQIFLIE